MWIFIYQNTVTDIFIHEILKSYITCILETQRSSQDAVSYHNAYRAPEKRLFSSQNILFFLFLNTTYIVDTHKKHLLEVFLVNTTFLWINEKDIFLISPHSICCGYSNELYPQHRLL